MIPAESICSSQSAIDYGMERAQLELARVLTEVQRRFTSNGIS